jgi:hypothetical protein
VTLPILSIANEQESWERVLPCPEGTIHSIAVLSFL